MKRWPWMLSLPFLFFLIACDKPASTGSTQDQITVDRAKLNISVKADSPFSAHLNVEKVKASGTLPQIKEKSSVIGLKGSSGWKFSNPDVPVVLSESLTAEVKEKNTILVRSRISRDLADQVKLGDKVFLSGDKLSPAHSEGRVIFIAQVNKSDIDDIYTVAPVPLAGLDMLDFYWMDFKFKAIRTFLIPIKAVLYISNEEYVLKKVGPSTYTPKHISIASHTLGAVVGYGGLVDGDEVLAEGAILLKPLMEDLVVPTYESQK